MRVYSTARMSAIERPLIWRPSPSEGWPSSIRSGVGQVFGRVKRWVQLGQAGYYSCADRAAIPGRAICDRSRYPGLRTRSGRYHSARRVHLPDRCGSEQYRYPSRLDGGAGVERKSPGIGRPGSSTSTWISGVKTYFVGTANQADVSIQCPALAGHCRLDPNHLGVSKSCGLVRAKSEFGEHLTGLLAELRRCATIRLGVRDRVTGRPTKRSWGSNIRYSSWNAPFWRSADGPFATSAASTARRARHTKAQLRIRGGLLI